MTVDLSSEEIQFELGLEDWETHLDRMIQVSNPHRFPVDFSVTCTAPQAFTVTPSEASIKPHVSQGPADVYLCL